MKISSTKYAQTLYELVEGKNKSEIKEILEKFVQVLISNRDTAKAEDIIEEFQKIWSQEKGIVDARLITSTDIDKKTLDIVKQYVMDATQAKQVNVQHGKDENIWGGAIIRYRDKVVDASLKSQVKQLKTKLIK